MIFIALGANLPSEYGSPKETLQAAKAVFPNYGIYVEAESRTWLTAPVPVSDQPWYHNEVVTVTTNKSPYQLLETLHTIENEFGRVRTVRNAPRLLDLDLIAYEDTVISKPELIVPHPRMHERSFVIYPLQEVAPADWTHPVNGAALSALASQLLTAQKAVPLSENDNYETVAV